MRQPTPRPDEVLRLLHAHKAAEDALRLYILGLLDGLHLERERFEGIDDETGDLLLHDPPDPGEEE